MDNKEIISGSGDETVKIWSIASAECVATLVGGQTSEVVRLQRHIALQAGYPVVCLPPTEWLMS